MFNFLYFLNNWFGSKQPKTLYLIRGLAGTGKTTLAEAITPYNVAADMLPGLYNKDGSYNKEKMGESHQWCKDTVERWMLQNKNKIAVHNTFVLNAYIEPYERLAIKYNYRFQVIKCEKEHGSVHGVPEEMMKKWRETWEDYKPISY
jgi:ATP-dependent phosphoenolpyruvate carboxykinase